MTANEVKVGLGSILLVAGGAYLFLVMYVIGFCGDWYDDRWGETPCQIPESYIGPAITLAVGSWFAIAGLKSRNLLPR
jgi:hypothetical protein